jgi:hypothetical protein
VERVEELAEISAWLEEHRPTRLPPGFAVEVQAALPLAEERERVARFQPVALTRSAAFREFIARIYGRR